ncbi:NAD(P)H-hydrate dehydratase [Trinickia soli]|uniref:Bifunctional NAD(P)H-hydrate repair enzyme n=1 Tax=Trinickia soli TaxID=380675 RepID=A0A2N7WEL6_9BURK|nr:NAD(P)H-hydrate dehydratase [Trinickia soli]PMS27880.1 NAD(P)H-hydrate dehydratase [Trinickia soli]CAB3657919.1 Bifunctional NAD(P)H-hydrate repair enzyme Nnr [Trinickia soli]
MTNPRPLPDHPPQLLSPNDRPLPLFTVAQLRELEARGAAGLPAHTLMVRAGAASAHYLIERAAHEGSLATEHPVWIAAGPGNNGGDALVLATRLRQAGIAAEVCMPVEVKAEDARWALGEARAAGVPISHVPPASLDAFGWVVDGLFGIGLARPLEGIFAELAVRIGRRATTHGRVLALDVPSGLDSDTGNVVDGGLAVRATETVTFLGAKPGLYMTYGRDLAGSVTLAPLGVDLPPAADVARLNAPALFAPHFPARSFASHKGTFGSLAVVGGDTGMCGAPILAARAALHTGAGKVHVAFVGEGAPAYDAPYPELMLHPPGTLAFDAMDALAVGCGMGRGANAIASLQKALGCNAPLLLDADALNLIASDTSLAGVLTAGAVKGASGADGTARPCVLTPHPLEAARLLGTDSTSIQRDRLGSARALAARFAAVVVLKGAGTVIASPDGRAAVNPTGNAALATGGTGDVLGGIIGALLAERLPGYEAALAGVYLHGLAAETLTAGGSGPAGLTAGELAPTVRTLLNRLIYPVRD